jgi:hypothetical protein
LQNVEEIQNSLSYFLMDLDKLQGKRKAPSNSIKQSWRPPEDFYKTNSDGAFHLETKSGECGFVVRNSLGDVLLAAAGNIAHDTSDIKTKAIAVFKSIQQSTKHSTINRVRYATYHLGDGCLKYGYQSLGC